MGVPRPKPSQEISNRDQTDRRATLQAPAAASVMTNFAEVANVGHGARPRVSIQDGKASRAGLYDSLEMRKIDGENSLG